MTDTQDAIAAFLAKGGKVTKAAEGEGLGLTNRQWYRAARDPVITRVIEDDSMAEAVAERQFEIGAGMGLDALNDFNSGLRKHGAKAMLGWK